MILYSQLHLRRRRRARHHRQYKLFVNCVFVTRGFCCQRPTTTGEFTHFFPHTISISKLYELINILHPCVINHAIWKPQLV